MSGRVRIYRGERPSNSARALGRACGLRVLRRGGTQFRARRGDLLINWGSAGDLPGQLAAADVLNDPAAVRLAVNKLACLSRLSSDDVPVPDWTTEPEVARGWGDLIVARTILNGTCGRGIVLAEPDGEVPGAPLYTRYFKGHDEYRVHVFLGEIIDQQQKRRRNGAEARNEIRNVANGWVFCRENVTVPAGAQAAARAAVASLGLDFGAVDLKWNSHYERAAVLEVNTAPGLEGTTLDRYAGVMADFVRTRRAAA